MWRLLQALLNFKTKVSFFLRFQLAEGLWTWLHKLTYSPGLNPKRVVVIGGSHGGYTVAKNLAKSLPSGYTVTVVEKDRHLNHVFAFPRYSVYGGYETNAFIPLDARDSSIYPKGSLNYVHALCTGIDTKRKVIELEDGYDWLDYEYLVICTGAKLTPPVALDHNGREEGINVLQKEQDRIKGAKNIAVLGAGAVGVELATDIKYKYGDEKHVTLFCSRNGVLPRFPSVVSEKAVPEMERLNVDLRLNCRPNVEGTCVVLPDGTIENYDLIYKCVGGKANSDAFVSALGTAVNPDNGGHIHVNKCLQVEGFQDIFAIGDVTDMGPQMARAAFMQAGVCRDNIMRLIKTESSEDLKEYVEQDFENALNLTLGLDRNLLHFNGSTDIIMHEDDLIMASDKIWQIFDVNTDSFVYKIVEESEVDIDEKA